ncbi:MAG: dihydrolipoyllysine-residue acetyltransferase [Ferrovum sp. 37-45-19]|jgi:pyruvate dehydrogenase E2 component (dihydrolipoamide acetyltransferase)|nr:MAG: dihydrolipoyllysine-residue acetyltransferase [Ferrovum sp. 21-44-67]OYV93763.1 MAG: dihydrolipoyllysine-residue acetyltransferase [Ferrovum sp. 37-45-19]OZB32292.1 MAG: dihydrolipoyllysine-residue acetyltransferase [Ferrovum sp. 34-44-207]HQT81374.1 dihydrolipoyllysine-residue acetyltransferase [Ferrovaceae bacterium]HQU06262.1 dihydrolipoyllysine-residue acetyltransferase [Ferrovaceae bacterium]
MPVEVKVPDIGDFKNIPVIELMVKVGDLVKKDDPLVTLESDKATMEVPASRSGTVTALHVQLGDRVSEGSLILTLEEANVSSTHTEALTPIPQSPQDTRNEPVSSAQSAAPTKQTGTTSSQASSAEEITITVPDIGNFENIPIIEIMAKVGDKVEANAPLITLESDKATMEVPAPQGGVITAFLVKLGDKVSQGVAIAKMTTASLAVRDTVQEELTAQSTGEPRLTKEVTQTPPVTVPSPQKPLAPEAQSVIDQVAFTKAHASPSVRHFARELGVDLSKVKGSAPKGRIVKEDVQSFVKSALAQVVQGATPGVSAGLGLGLLPWPQVDFAKFGAIEVQPLSRIKKISGANLHRNWVMIPHVTNNDDADITELEAFRVQLNLENKQADIKVTMLAFLIKAVCNALRKFPQFNASLDGDNLVVKHYYHIGFAADTPNGLMVPVIKDADKKGVLQIAQEASQLAKKARDGKLSPADMQGGTFSISSLGGIGGTYFTPIINAPEVAILGVCRSSIKPVWRENQFQPRLILPLSLSYDHRVIDGALAARFNTYLVELLADLRRATL